MFSLLKYCICCIYNSQHSSVQLSLLRLWTSTSRLFPRLVLHNFLSVVCHTHTYLWHSHTRLWNVCKLGCILYVCLLDVYLYMKGPMHIPISISSIMQLFFSKPWVPFEWTSFLSRLLPASVLMWGELCFLLSLLWMVYPCIPYISDMSLLYLVIPLSSLL